MLELNGIDTLFCLPGVQNDSFFDALYDRTNAIRPIHARHEQACAYMALGYAMASGKPSAYVVVPGPGFLNTTAALSTAYAVNAPVLALTGQIQQSMIGRNVGLLHELPDQLVDHARPHQVGRPHHRAGRGARPGQRGLPPAAVGPPAPVALECAMDTWGRKAPVVLPTAAAQADPCPVDEDGVERAAKLLGSAQAPADRGRRRRTGRGRIRAADRRDARGAGDDRPMGQGVIDGRHRLSVTSLGRLPLLERGRRRAGGRHAPAAASR